MTETLNDCVITEESTGKKDKKQNLWKMFRRKKGNNTTSTSQMSKLHKKNAKNNLGNTIFYYIKSTSILIFIPKFRDSNSISKFKVFFD